MTPVQTTDEFEKEIVKAVQRAPSRNAEVNDGHFVEAFKMEPTWSAKTLRIYWQKCADFKYVLRDWKTAILTPVYKRIDPSGPTSYIPIGILSHVTKVIHSTIAEVSRVNTNYTPHRWVSRTH